MKRMNFAAGLLLVLSAFPALASDGVLVPVFFGGPGALGAVWRTRLTLLNNSDRPVEGVQILLPCAIPEGCITPIPAKSSITFLAVDGFRYDKGFFLYPGAGIDVSYSLRAFDESRSAVNYGTDIPVVPIDSFSEKPLQLLDVPTDSAFRVTLRLYALPTATPRVRVSVLKDPEPSFPGQPPAPQLLRERFYDLAPSPFGPTTGSFSRSSGVLVGDLLDGLGFTGSVRIEVQSASTGVPVWSMATVTNNETQMVTVVVPRPSPQ